MFKVIGYGRLTKDPDLKTVTTAKGKELAKELTIVEFDVAGKSKSRQGMLTGKVKAVNKVQNDTSKRSKLK